MSAIALKQLLGIATLVAVVAAGPLCAADASLHAEVLKMLRAGLSEEVIMDWLPVAERSGDRPSADDLIALKEAGASEALLKAILERSRPEPDAGPAEPSRATPQRSVRPDPVAEEPAPEAGPAVAFTLTYLPRFEDPEPEWDLYVYLDGKPLSYLAAETVLDRPRLIAFKQRLPPGPHLVRVTQERHTRGGGGRWQHAVRVAEEAFAFDLVAGTPAEFEMEFRQSRLSYRDPLSFKVTQNERIEDSGPIGGDPGLWPLLCDDAEANAETGHRSLESCVRWATLWDDPETPSRAEVRRALELFDYRPVPKGS